MKGARYYADAETPDTPVSDALTVGERLQVCQCLELAVRKHDRRGDTRALLADVMATVRMMNALAHTTPDDSTWRNNGHVRLPALTA